MVCALTYSVNLRPLTVFCMLDEPDGPLLPQPTEVIKNGIKTITEYKRNEEDKLVKVSKIIPYLLRLCLCGSRTGCLSEKAHLN